MCAAATLLNYLSRKTRNRSPAEALSTKEKPDICAGLGARATAHHGGYRGLGQFALSLVLEFTHSEQNALAVFSYCVFAPLAEVLYWVAHFHRFASFLIRVRFIPPELGQDKTQPQFLPVLGLFVLGIEKARDRSPALLFSCRSFAPLIHKPVLPIPEPTSN